MTHVTDETSGQQGLTDQASAKVQDVASAAQDKASALREQGSLRLRDQFDQRSNQAGTQVRSLAEALRRSGNDLSNEGNRNAAQLTDQAADRIERIGTYLEQKRGDELMHDVETFARRRPWMLTGIGMLAGVAAARFMKASSEQRYSGDRTNKQQWQTRHGVPTGRSGAYERGELAGSGYGAQTVGSDVPASRDDPLARDPYAGTR